MTTAIVTATNKPALEAAHGGLAAWVERRITEARAQLQEVRDGLALARERGHGTQVLGRQARKLEKQVVFLDKVQGAIRAGYHVIPNLPLDVIAVRTDRTPPQASGEERPILGAARLPAGVGEFVAPEPEFQSWGVERVKKDGSKYSVTMYAATEHAPVDLPFVLVHGELGQALNTALRECLFDEIGVVRDRPKGDPLLVGRINHPNARLLGGWRGQSREGVAFLIGWWFDPTSLDG